MAEILKFPFPETVQCKEGLVTNHKFIKNCDSGALIKYTSTVLSSHPVPHSPLFSHLSPLLSTPSTSGHFPPTVSLDKLALSLFQSKVSFPARSMSLTPSNTLMTQNIFDLWYAIVLCTHIIILNVTRADKYSTLRTANDNYSNMSASRSTQNNDICLSDASVKGVLSLHLSRYTTSSCKHY